MHPIAGYWTYNNRTRGLVLCTAGGSVTSIKYHRLDRHRVLLYARSPLFTFDNGRGESRIDDFLDLMLEYNS